MQRLRQEWHHWLPTEDALGRALRRVRRREGMRHIMRSTAEGNEFLRYEQDGMAIFADDSDLRFLASSPHWFGDGTFKITPVGFEQ